jgi:hypothetical protein
MQCFDEFCSSAGHMGTGKTKTAVAYLVAALLATKKHSTASFHL